MKALELSSYNDQFPTLIEHYRVGEIFTMPVYEGPIELLRYTYPEHKKIAPFPFNARIVLGTDLCLPQFNPDGRDQFPDAFTSLFFNAIADIESTLAYYEGLSDTYLNQLLYSTIMRKYREKPQLPINVIYAHGENEGGEHKFELFYKRRYPLRLLISKINQLDKLTDNDPSSTIILASCNKDGDKIEGNATIIYPRTLIGLMRGNGKIFVHEPK